VISHDQLDVSDILLLTIYLLLTRVRAVFLRSVFLSSQAVAVLSPHFVAS
jgi:hypothetical protein